MLKLNDDKVMVSRFFSFHAPTWLKLLVMAQNDMEGSMGNMGVESNEGAQVNHNGGTKLVTKGRCGPLDEERRTSARIRKPKTQLRDFVWQGTRLEDKRGVKRMGPST